MRVLYDYKKCLWAIPLALLVNIECLRPEAEGALDGDLNYFFLNSLFDVQSYEGGGSTILVLSFMSMSFILIFSMLCGMDIYKEMYSSGIYAMIRVKSKEKWIASLIAMLAGKTVIFSLLYAIVDWLLQRYYTGMGGDTRSFFAFGLAVAFLFFSSFLVALIINFFSIVINTRSGILAGVVVFSLLILFILFYEKIPIIGVVYNFRFIDPLYMCNLFYEESKVRVGLTLLYYLSILIVCSCYFVHKVKTLDIKLLNEDI